MKILIIANSNIVFGKELKNELININQGMDVSLLDFESLVLSDRNNKENIKYGKKFSRYKNIPKFSMFFRMLHIKKIIEDNNFDVINIHYSRWFYLLILPTLIKQKLVITFYGGDFYGTSNLIKNIQKAMYRKADDITFTNPLTMKSFLEYYNDFEEKSHVCRFGLKTLDFIDKNRDKDILEIRKYLGYRKDKIIVTCGYNSTKEQQHEEIIKSIERLEDSYKDKCQFIFPFTYGNNTQKKIIKNKLKNSNFDYIVLEDYLYEDDNAYIKLASDIMINILQTDSFSGSMQEFLYAGNIIVTGSWLPYGTFDEERIVYYKIDDVNNLKRKLMYVIDNIKEMKNNLYDNKEIIYKLSSWKNNIKNWKNIYVKG